MFLTDVKRIIRSGFANFWRSGFVSMSSVLVMTVALSMIGSTLLLSAFLGTAMESIQDKVDINVYFNIDAEENEILALKESLELLPEVKSISYISREQALLDFRTRNENNYLTLQALDELEDNPLRALLNVKANDTSNYSNIANFLEKRDVALSVNGAGIIDKVNYNDEKNKIIIDRLSKIINGIQRFGFLITIALIFVSVIITFNTLRLVIYISREEINVMRLVGADNKYVRGPFVVQGVIYGVVSAVLATALFYPLTSWLKNSTGDFYGGIDLFKYYITNFGQIFGILIVSGVLLGMVSSFLTVRRYLKN